jgi:hypothetical protein
MVPASVSKESAKRVATSKAVVGYREYLGHAGTGQ